MLTFKDKQPGRTRRALALAAFAASMAFVPGTVLAEGDAASRLTALETEAQTLSTTLDGLSNSLSAFLPPKAIAVNDVAPVIQVAQSRDAATAVRLDQLEEQMRLLNGQVEGLQFQLTQLQTLLERMQEDADARFAALEGGAPSGKTSAAPQTGGATLSGGAPQSTGLAAPGATDDVFGTGEEPIDLGAPIELGAPEQPLGTLTLGDLQSAADASGGNIDIGREASLVTDADADAQYRAGYDAVIKGDYAFAEDQFRQFIALFPDHPQAPDATNWLGEALIQRGDYEEAADILLTGFQSYPNAARSPDILMKLGIALAGTGETETACRTFAEVMRRFPGTSPAFQQRLGSEMALAGC